MGLPGTRLRAIPKPARARVVPPIPGFDRFARGEVYQNPFLAVAELPEFKTARVERVCRGGQFRAPKRRIHAFRRMNIVTIEKIVGAS